MSKNIKYTTYTVTSIDGVTTKKMFGEMEIQAMIRYVQEQNKSEICMIVTKSTITMNYHLSKDKFPWLKQQKAPEQHTKIYRVERYCGVGEPNSPNAGFFDFIGYHR